MSTKYLSVFSPNAGKYKPEKLQIRTLFTKCKMRTRFKKNMKRKELKSDNNSVSHFSFLAVNILPQDVVRRGLSLILLRKNTGRSLYFYRRPLLLTHICLTSSAINTTNEILHFIFQYCLGYHFSWHRLLYFWLLP